MRWFVVIAQEVVILNPLNFDLDDDQDCPCYNGATCNAVRDPALDEAWFECLCRRGYNGTLCEKKEYFTLQQWRGDSCAGTPWRCFKLTADLCTDTLATEGDGSQSGVWHGELDFVPDSGEEYVLTSTDPGDWIVRLCFVVGRDMDSCSCSDPFELRTPNDELDDCAQINGETSTRLIKSDNSENQFSCFAHVCALALLSW